jgi:uncharacterized protein (DUF1501 family)
MSTNRRDFLQQASALLAGGAALPAFLRQAALAAAEKPTGDNILVVVQLTGGNDGLNTVVPFADENYRRLRPKLHLADARLHKLDDRVGLHPSLEALARLFKEGSAAIVQGVGYPHPNRSHFESMAIWHTAPTDLQLERGKPTIARGGWLARAIDRQDGGASSALRVGSSEMPQALLGSRVPVPSLASLEELKSREGLLDREAAKAQLAGWRSAESAANPLLQAAARGAVAVEATAAEIEKIAPRSTTVGYPDYELGQRLRLIAELVRAGFETTIYYTELGGFDTHANQANRHSGLLSQFGRSLAAFVDDIERNADRRVSVLAFSEFGRRAAENASAGTDHGTAGPVFLAGSGLAGGLHGPHPDLANLVDGDPVFAVDFRQVYATVLEDWLDVGSEPVLGQKFERLALFQKPTA